MNTTNVTTGTTSAAPLRIMLDIESWGTQAGAGIISIGAVVWDEDGPSSEGERNFYVEIDPVSCVRHGLRLEPETVLWWIGQTAGRVEDPLDPGNGDAAAMFRRLRDGAGNAPGGQKVMGLLPALSALREWVKGMCAPVVPLEMATYSFGLVRAPEGCYLLTAGEVIREGDLSLHWVSEEMREWNSASASAGLKIAGIYAGTYARKLEDGPGPREVEVWSRGGMDAALIEGALRAVGREPIWDFWRVRDVRTLAAVVKAGPEAGYLAGLRGEDGLAERLKHEDSVYGAHHALGDARRQAWHAAVVLRGLRKGGEQEGAEGTEVAGEDIVGKQKAAEAEDDAVPVPGRVLKEGENSTVEEWLEQIPDDMVIVDTDGEDVAWLRNAALLRRKDCAKNAGPVSSIQDAIWAGIRWKDTPEGFDFWERVYRQFLNNRPMKLVPLRLKK